MSEPNFNVCDEILDELYRLGMDGTVIDKIKGHQVFIDAYDKHYKVQRTMLTTLFFKILMSGSVPPPAEIRLALNSGNDIISWLSDIKLVIIPFIKENLDKLNIEAI